MLIVGLIFIFLRYRGTFQMDLKLVYDNPYQLVEELIHYIEYHDPILQNIKGTSDNLFYFNRVKDILYIYTGYST